MNHTTIDTYSGAQVTFPKSDLSLVKNPTSFLVKEKSHFINTTLRLCQTHHPKEEKCLCRTHHHHPKEEKSHFSLKPPPSSTISQNPSLKDTDLKHHHHQPSLKTTISVTWYPHFSWSGENESRKNSIFVKRSSLCSLYPGLAEWVSKRCNRLRPQVKNRPPNFNQ